MNILNYKFWILRLLIEWSLIMGGLAGVYFHFGVALTAIVGAALITIVLVTNGMMKEEKENVPQIFELPNGKLFIGPQKEFEEFMEKVEKGEINLDGETERREDEV